MYSHSLSVCLPDCLSKVHDLLHIVPLMHCCELSHLSVSLYYLPMSQLHDFSVLRPGCVLTPNVTLS